MDANIRYIKDENRNIISPITSTDSVYGKDGVNLTTALQNIGSLESVPVGTIIEYSSSQIPDNYLLCNGAAIDRATYIDLFNVIGTTYGEGNGTSTFNLPTRSGYVTTSDSEDSTPVVKYFIIKYKPQSIIASQDLVDIGSRVTSLEEITGDAAVPIGTVIPYEGTDTPEGWVEVGEMIDDGLPIGSGMDYFGTTAPTNYMFANGAAISRTEYAELFSIIGTTYGAGDGSTTFNLPDKRNRVTAMYSEGDSNFGTLGGKLGSATHSHKYGIQFGAYWREFIFESNPNAGMLNYNEDGTFEVSVPADISLGATIAYNSSTTATTKSASCAHQRSVANTEYISNLQPTLVCNYIIKVKKASLSTYDLVSSMLGGSY